MNDSSQVHPFPMKEVAHTFGWVEAEHPLHVVAVVERPFQIVEAEV